MNKVSFGLLFSWSFCLSINGWVFSNSFLYGRLRLVSVDGIASAESFESQMLSAQELMLDVQTCEKTAADRKRLIMFVPVCLLC